MLGLCREGSREGSCAREREREETLLGGGEAILLGGGGGGGFHLVSC
jgi:hypothetical protein